MATNPTITEAASSECNTEGIKSSQQCVFCKIVNDEAPCQKIWETETHLAFLSIFPNTKGVTVVIPKQHYSSYAFEMPEADFTLLMQSARQVAVLLDEKLAVGRTALVLEGFGIDHVHAKLFPMHGTRKDAKWKPIASPKEKKEEYFEAYAGYISSHDGKRANDDELAILAEQIRS